MVELITRSGIALGAVMSVGASVAATPVDVEPLEVVAVDVSDFPQVVIDVALPDRELPGHVRAADFEMPGATGVVAEALVAADLTVALVLDDRVGTPLETIATQQGAVTELVRNIPDDVELITATTGGTIVGPSTDRAETLGAVATLGMAPSVEGGTVATPAIRAAAALEGAPDQRHQLVVISGAHAEITTEEAEVLMTSLDQSMSALRVLTIGGEAGARLSSVAAATGGFAVDVGTGAAAALRAVDVLTTTFTDQYRVTATVATAGDQVVRLTVAGRQYEAVVPDLGASSAAPPSTVATTTSTSTSTTTTPPTTSPATTAPGAVQGPPPADDAESQPSERRDRAPSVLAGAQAVVAVAAIGAIIAAVRKRRRRR